MWNQVSDIIRNQKRQYNTIQYNIHTFAFFFLGFGLVFFAGFVACGFIAALFGFFRFEVVATLLVPFEAVGPFKAVDGGGWDSLFLSRNSSTEEHPL